MRSDLKFSMALLLLACLGTPAMAVENLLTNPGFEGLDINGNFGNGWGTWDSVGFDHYWGADVHAILWGDRAGNIGGIFQPGIVGGPETAYQFVLFNTRIESNWSANLRFGLEYYASDDSTKLGETIVSIDAAARLANGQIDSNVFAMQGTPVEGTVYVRPVFQFDNVNPAYNGQPQATAFVFDTFMSFAPAPGEEFLKNPGFEDLNADGALGDYWGRWGNVDFNAFFGANGHTSLFADQTTNSGGVWQQGILGQPDAQYRFELTDVRIEANWDADLYYGLEFYAADDYHKLGETVVQADTSTKGDGLSFSMLGRAVAGTVYVRPFVRFDNVRSSGGTQRNAFIFSAALTQLPLIYPGDLDGDRLVNDADLDVFEACATAPAVPYDPAGLPIDCTLTPDAENYILADLDKDRDIDQDDFGILQRCYRGTAPADPECAQLGS